MAETDSSSKLEPSPFTSSRPSLLQSLLPSTHSADLPRYLPLPIPLPVQTMALPTPPNFPFPSPAIEEVASFPRIRTHGLEILSNITTTPLSLPVLPPAGNRDVTSIPREFRGDSSDDTVSPLSSAPGMTREGSEEDVMLLRKNDVKKDGGYFGFRKKAQGREENTKGEKATEDLRKLALQRINPPMKAECGGFGNTERNENDDDDDQDAWYTPNEDSSKNYDNIDASKTHRPE